MLNADIVVGAALIYSEKELLLVDGLRQGIQPCHFVLAALEPSCGALNGALYVVPRSGVLYALVERHRNGGGKVRLYLHALLRTDEQALSVDVAGEIYALLLYFAELRQRKDLKSAAVGKYGLVPVHELVEPAQLVDYVIAGAQVEVIGIAQLHLGFQPLQVDGGNAALYRCGGAYVHEERRFYRAVRGVEYAPARASLGLFQFKHVCSLFIP